jgi:hypothetical protein
MYKHKLNKWKWNFYEKKYMLSHNYRLNNFIRHFTDITVW